MKELLEFLDSDEWDIVDAWITKDAYGMLDRKNRTIVINLALFIVDTFVHEYYHMKYPELDNDEDTIIAKTNNRIKRMTVDEVIALAATILDKITENKLDLDKEEG